MLVPRVISSPSGPCTVLTPGVIIGISTVIFWKDMMGMTEFTKAWFYKGIILAILALSVGLGFVNEYSAEQVAADLHAHVQDTCTVTRDGREVRLPLHVLVPGDIVTIDMGEVVPADLRLLQVSGLECNESVLTGESTAIVKTAATLAVIPTSLAEHGN